MCRSPLRAFLLTAVLVGAGACGGDGDTAPEQPAQSSSGPFSRNRSRALVFSAIPDTRGTQLAERFDAVARWLTERLDVPVVYRATPDYGASVEAFANGDLAFAWFGGLTGVQARTLVPGARAIVQGAEDPDYYSYFIAHPDAGIAPLDVAALDGRDPPFPLEALRGKTFTFASPKSTSGRLIPEYAVRSATGDAPREFFAGEPGFAGSHDNVVAQVDAGAYEVGAVNYKVFERMQAAGDVERAFVVWRTPAFADYNLTVHPDIDAVYGEGSIERLQRVLLDCREPEVLAAFDRSALIAASNDQFEALTTVARQLGFVPEVEGR